MAIKFKNFGILINSKGLIIEDANLDNSLGVQPNYAVGYKYPIHNSLNQPPTTNINLSYILEIHSGEPNINILNTIKNYQSSHSPATIIFGGTTGNYYLTSFSFSVLPNEAIKAQSTYISYDEINGNLQTQLTGYQPLYNLTNSTGIGHYWSTFPLNEAESTTGSVLQFSYNFRINWLPDYRIGSKTPVSVTLGNAEETFEIITEMDAGFVTYNLPSADSYFTNFSKFKLFGISKTYNTGITYAITFPLSGAKINKFSVSAPNNNIITVASSLTKFY